MIKKKYLKIGAIILFLAVVLCVFITLSSKKNQDPEVIGGTEFSTNEKALTLNNPILEGLPYDGYFFRIDYGRSAAKPTDNNAFSIIITYADDSGRQAALSILREYGHNPSDYEIIYKADPLFISTK